MKTALRHLLSIFLLPFMVAVVVPRWILASWAVQDSRWPSGSALALVGLALGNLCMILGLGLFIWCVRLFAKVGRGTLAPWDPTERLVVVGPYRHSRNPMITSVALLLAGQALLFGSRFIAGWLGVFIVINHLYFLISEEPGLTRRFGESYIEYSRAVPRWIPRIHPWPGDERRSHA